MISATFNSSTNMKGMFVSLTQLYYLKMLYFGLFVSKEFFVVQNELVKELKFRILLEHSREEVARGTLEVEKCSTICHLF
jgi:hypothetical protein